MDIWLSSTVFYNSIQTSHKLYHSIPINHLHKDNYCTCSNLHFHHNTSEFRWNRHSTHWDNSRLLYYNNDHPHEEYWLADSNGGRSYNIRQLNHHNSGTHHGSKKLVLIPPEVRRVLPSPLHEVPPGHKASS